MPEYPWIIYRMSEGPLTTKEVHQGVNEQLNRKLGTDWGYSEYEWANLLQGFRPLPIRTASGTIAHFTDGADGVPLKSLTAQILPIQSGTGTPSPSNPRPISGTSVLNVEQRGANVWDEQVEEGYIYISGNALYYGSNASTFRSKNFIPCVGGQNYYVVCSGYSSWRLFGVDANKENPSQLAAGLNSKVVSIPSGISFLKFYVEEGGKEYANDISINYPSTDTSYHAYTGSTYAVNLGQTVYGGSAEVVGGTGEETSGYGKITDLATNYFYSTANKRWEVSGIPNLKSFPSRSIEGLLSDIWQPNAGAYTGDEGVFFTVNGVIYFYTSNSDSLDGNIVYPLATPTEYTFTGQPINSYLGVNNVWTDSGEVLDVEYRSNF